MFQELEGEIIINRDGQRGFHSSEEIVLILEPKARVLTILSNALQNLDTSTFQNSSLTLLSAPTILATSLSLEHVKHTLDVPSA